MKNRFFYYRNALIPTSNAQLSNDIFSPNLSYKEIVKEWKNATKSKKHPLFCMFPTEIDCGYETSWWYNIKDDEYDIKLLNSNRRHKITKGLKNFYTEIIEPEKFVNEIFDVYQKAFSGFPEKYRPSINYNNVENQVKNKYLNWIGAFSKESGKLCGFLIFSQNNITDEKSSVPLISQKSIPEFEKLNVNFALLDCFLNHFNSELKEKKVIITNGQRNLSHETQFNEFLEKYFGFRKAYCHLHIKFHPMIAPFANLLYICTPPHWKNADFRTDNPILYKISLILKYMKIAKECKKQCNKNKKSQTS